MEITKQEEAPFIADTPERRAILVLMDQRNKAEATVERQRLELARINRLYLQKTEVMSVWEGAKVFFKTIISKIKNNAR